MIPVWKYLAFLVVILAAAFARFYNLSGHGLSVCDAFIYTTTAKQWYFYHSFTNFWAKPGYYLLCCVAIRLFGFYDFTFLYLNSLLDIVNIILLVLIGFKMGLRRIFILSAALIYAFLPYIVEQSMNGLPHLASGTFFMAAFYVFLIYFNTDRKPLWLLFLTGALIIFAGNVHPTLFCGAVFFGVVLAMLSIRRWRTLNGLLIYCLGCASIFAGFALLMSNKDKSFFASLNDLIKIILFHRQAGTQGHSGNILSQAFYFLGGLASIITIPFVIFFLVIACIFIIVKLKPGLLKPDFSKSPCAIKPMNLLLLWGCIINFLVLNLLTVLAWQYRLLVPVIPLTVLGLVALVDRFAYEFPNEWFPGRKFLMVVTAIVLCNVCWNWGLFKNKTPTVYRQMANVLYHKVDDEHRLLITPSFFFAPMFYLEEGYFEGDDLYRVKEPWQPDLSLLQAYHIKYVAIAKDLNADKIIPNSFFDSDLQGKEEYFLLYYGLNALGAKLLYDSEQVSIFEIPIKDALGSPHATPEGLPFFNIGRGINNQAPPQLYVLGIK